jgi:ATP-binding cassette subfamily B multidrug efflux pump
MNYAEMKPVSDLGVSDFQRSKRPGIRLLFSQIKAHWPLYVGGAFGILLVNLTELAFPKFMQWGIDTVLMSPNSQIPKLLQGENNSQTLMYLAIGLFCVSIVALISRACWRQCLARRSHWSGYWLRKNLWESICHQPLQIFNRYPMGDLINRCISDVNPARFVLGFTHVNTWDTVFFSTIGTLSLFFMDTRIAIASLIVFLILPFLIQKLVKEEFRLHDEAQAKLSRLSERITQMVATVRLQRASAMENMWVRHLSQDAKTYAEKQFEVEKTAWACFPYGGGATFLCYLIIFSLGLPRIVSGEMTVGQFVGSLSLVLLLQGPLFSLSEILAEWQKGLASLNRIAEIIDLAKPSLANRPDVALNQSLSLENLSFSYNGVDRAVLNNLSLSLEVGVALGISGEIGAGKSTLLHLIAGLEPSSSGLIRIFGKDVMSTSREEITKLISLVPQKPFLFAGTIRENLCLESDFSDDELWSVLDDMRLGEDFRKLKLGLKTIVGEWGISLSGGQRQRMALARALLRPKPILLLDDCLSAVDAVTEEFIVRAIKRRIKDVTVIWVAHRPSTLKLCDIVYDLKQGKLVKREGASHGRV